MDRQLLVTTSLETNIPSVNILLETIKNIIAFGYLQVLKYYYKVINSITIYKNCAEFAVHME